MLTPDDDYSSDCPRCGDYAGEFGGECSRCELEQMEQAEIEERLIGTQEMYRRQEGMGQ